jgi:spore germination protein GerM
MQKGVWLLAILGAIMLILIGILIFVPAKESNKSIEPTIVKGIEINSIKINDEISSPLKIIGSVNGDGWVGFEGQVGTVKLLDANGQQLGQTAILTATTDWMTSSVNFQTYLQFLSNKDQEGTLVFKNENPSDMRDKDRTFSLPVKILKSSEEIMTIKVFFNNNIMDPAISCEKVFAVNREVPKTTAVARAALEELLKGVTYSDVNQGFSTSINEGVKIQSLTIENGVANVDFNEQLGYQVGGSCKVSTIRAQIIQTLKQFPTVKNVIISINGRTEDILQP